MIHIHQHNRLLFIGDSITAAGRHDYYGSDLGQGYVAMIASQLYRQYFHYHLDIQNRGIGGDCLADIADRWDQDCLALSPHKITIQVGINDLWHAVSRGQSFTSENIQRFIQTYDQLLQHTHTHLPESDIILVEPFAFEPFLERYPVTDTLHALQQAIQILAQKHNATFVKTHIILNRLAKGLGTETLTVADGIHPTTFAHAHLAERWFVATQL